MTTHDDFFSRSSSSEGTASQTEGSASDGQAASSRSAAAAPGLLRERSPFAGPYSGRLADLAGEGRVTLLGFDWFGRRADKIRRTIASLAAQQVPPASDSGEPTVVATFGRDRGLLDALSSACSAESRLQASPVEALLLEMNDTEATASDLSLVAGVDLLARSNGVGQLFGYASRLLRPGGRLILIDFFLRDDLNCSDLDEGDRLSLENLSRLRLNAPLKTASQLDWLAGRFDLEPIEQKSMNDVFPLERRQSGLAALFSGLTSWRILGGRSGKPTNRQDYSELSGRDALTRCLERGLVEVRMRVWQRLKPVSLEVDQTDTVN